MFKLTLFVALFGLISSASLSIDNQWESFKAKHGRVYSSDEEEIHRKSIFIDNLKKIETHNEKAANGEVTYKLGINKFADLTYDEFKSSYLKLNPSIKKPAPFVHNVELILSVNDSSSVDWREKGIVAEVKDQSYCEGCWAFSAVAAIEGAQAQKSGKLISLSEQQLIDCSWNYDNHGCSGGVMDSAFEYVIDNKGIDTEESYPFVSSSGLDSKTCKYTSSGKGASISSYVDIPEGNENALLSAVNERVVSVAIDAESDFQLYKSGIYNSKICSSSASNLNHGVTAVGYGTENNTPYWIIKNSWGEEYGENGYVRVYRGSNMCGIAEMASYPLI